MRTASLLILVLILKSSWEPSSACIFGILDDFIDVLIGGYPTGGSGIGTSGVTTGGSNRPVTSGGNGGQGGGGGHSGQSPSSGQGGQSPCSGQGGQRPCSGQGGQRPCSGNGGSCRPNGCGVPHTGCNSPSGCNPYGCRRTVADESTDSPGESELQNLIIIDIHIPVYIYIPSEMQAFTDKQRIASSFTEKLIPNLTQNSEGTSEKTMTSNFIESVATSVPVENPMSAIKDMQKNAQGAGKSRLPRSAENRLNGYLDYEAKDEVTIGL